MQKPDKSSYHFVKNDYGIALFAGIATSLIAGTVGFLVGGLVHGLPRQPFEVMSISWVWIPALVGYFIPLVWDIHTTNAMNKPRKTKYALDMAEYNSYDESKQKREIENFIEECKNE